MHTVQLGQGHPGGSLWYSIKLQTNIYQHAKYQLDPSTYPRDIDL